MLAFLIWIPTLYFLPQYLYILPLIYIIIFRKKIIIAKFQCNKYKIALIIISIIIILSSLNYLLNLNNVTKLKNIIVPNFAYLFTFFIAISIVKKDLKILVWLLFVEVIFIYIEFFLRINTIYFWQSDFKKINHIVYLYSFRPHGLSSGSSTMGYKLLVLLILFDYLKLNSLNYKMMKILSIGALIIVFSRTPLIAYILYLFFQYLFNDNPKKILLRIIIFTFISLVIFYILYVNGILEIIFQQINRGKNGIDLSYRNIIWAEQFNFIKKHLIFGNHSFKYLVPLNVYGPNVFEHAHNSFIEILSTNGIIIFLFYILLIFIFLRKWNWLFIVTFMILSLYQYAIFWGISFIDIIFLKILLDKE